MSKWTRKIAAILLMIALISSTGTGPAAAMATESLPNEQPRGEPVVETVTETEGESEVPSAGESTFETESETGPETIQNTESMETASESETEIPPPTPENESMKLTVYKDVQGTMGDVTKAFNFNIKILRNGRDITETLTDAKFTLKDKDTNPSSFFQVDGLKQGDRVEVTEASTGENYIVSVNVDRGSSDTDPKDSVYSGVITEDTTITFIHRMDLAPPTGIRMCLWPYILCFAAAGLWGLLIIDKKKR